MRSKRIVRNKARDLRIARMRLNVHIINTYVPKIIL